MNTRTERKRTGMRLLVAAAVVSLTMALSAGVALADTPDVIVTGGSLGLTGGTVEDFTGVTLDGGNQTTTAQISDVVVTDATGTGVGWRLQITGAVLAGTGDISAKSIAASQVTVKKLAGVTAGAGVTAADPELDGNATFALPTSATNLATAAVDAGMGQYTLDCPADMLTLVVPASSYAGTYSTTITLDTVSGPGL